MFLCLLPQQHDCTLMCPVCEKRQTCYHEINRMPSWNQLGNVYVLFCNNCIIVVSVLKRGPLGLQFRLNAIRLCASVRLLYYYNVRKLFLFHLSAVICHSDVVPSTTTGFILFPLWTGKRLTGNWH